MARVIISAGHTNRDPGTIINGLREADLTKQISKEVIKQLREANIITLSVPPELDLAKRIEWINLTGYNESTNDLTVEIHINDGGKKGIEGWFQADKNNSQKLTQDIVDEVMKTTGWPSQGNHNEYEHPLGSLAFLHNTHPIASLIECGYLDNPEDFKILNSQEGINKISTGIANGIKKFLEIGQNRPKTVNAQPQQIQTAPPVPIQSFNRPTAGYQNPVQVNYPNFQSPPVGMGSLGPMGGSMGGISGGMGAGMNQAGAGFMSRDQRRDMIKNNYIKILGREPSPSDLNYFLNIGINEDQLIKKMVDSQEHVDLVKARQEVIQIKKQFIEQRSEILRLKTKVNDQRGILQNLNSLLMQKNRAIVDQQQKLQMADIKGGGKPVQKKIKYQKNKGEKFLDYFSDKLGK